MRIFAPEYHKYFLKPQRIAEPKFECDIFGVSISIKVTGYYIKVNHLSTTRYRSIDASNSPQTKSPFIKIFK